MTGRRRALGRPFALCALIVVLALAVAACGSSGKSKGGSTGGKTAASAPATGGKVQGGTVIFGSLPAAGTPTTGGTITLGQITGMTPTDIFPIVSGSLASTPTFNLNASMFIPLYNGPTGATPKADYGLSAANPPLFSNGDKTVTIPIKTGLKWADGAPVDSQDVLFYIDLLKAALKESPANWGQYVPGEFPANVTSVSAPNSHTVVMHLNKAYNPGYFLNNQLQDTNGGVYPLPATAWNIEKAGGPHLSNWSDPGVAKKIFDYLSKQGQSVATFGTNPLWKDVDGPFKLTSFSATNSSYNEVPNPTYGLSPKAVFSNLSVQTYTSATAALNAFKSGSLDVIPGPNFDFSEVPQIPQLKNMGASVYGGPGWGWFGGIINFKDKTNDFNNVIKQLYVRQAIAHLIDQPGIIKGVYKNAAATSYGPVPSAPASPYTPADAVHAPYPYSPSAAVSLLKAHGWKVVPNGQTTCAKAGTATDECGAGIPAGTPINFTWANQPEAVASNGVLESEALASIAKQAAGITIQLQTKTFNFLTSNYNNVNPANVKYTNDWGVNNYGGLFTDYYPTGQGTWNPGGGFNIGTFNDPAATKLMSASVHSANLAAVKTEASYLTKNFPVFFLPNQDNLSAVSKKVGGPANSWLVLTQQQEQPQFWYLTK